MRLASVLVAALALAVPLPAHAPAPWLVRLAHRWTLELGATKRHPVLYSFHFGKKVRIVFRGRLTYSKCYGCTHPLHGRVATLVVDARTHHVEGFSLR